MLAHVDGTADGGEDVAADAGATADGTVRADRSKVPRSARRLLGGALAVHLVASAVHGVPHVAVPVQQSAVPTVAIPAVVYVLPVAGVAALRRGRGRAGAALFTASMAVSLVLGVVLHFLVANPDHVSAIPPGRWHRPFLATAVAVAAVDAGGTAVGAWVWRGRQLAAREREARGSESARGVDATPSGRIAGVRSSEAGPLARLVYWFSKRWYDEVPEPLRVTAHHRAILAGSSAFETALDRADAVDGHLVGLAYVKAATMVGCEFCVDIGTAEAEDRGVTEAQLRHLADFEDSDAFTERERLVLRYAAAVTETPTAVPDELFDALAAEFDDAQLVELTAAVAYENYRARFNHAFGVGAQGFAEGAYCPRPASAGDDAAESSPGADGVGGG